jgi:hypothetical protein
MSLRDKTGPHQDTWAVRGTAPAFVQTAGYLGHDSEVVCTLADRPDVYGPLIEKLPQAFEAIEVAIDLLKQVQGAEQDERILAALRILEKAQV